VTGVHPIEAESYRILDERVDLSRFGPLSRQVVARVIHATADPDYAETMVVDDGAVAAGVAALRAGAPVVTDVEMVRHGIAGLRGPNAEAGIEARCYLPGPGPTDDGLRGRNAADGLTRSAAGMRAAARHHPQGAVVVVGCAPTALDEVVRLAATGDLAPALVVGLPVGFVGAAAAKEALRASGLPAISNVGERGGSPVAAAAVNALVRLAATGTAP
jgi:precorrin-8X/cobalt-precorrin-8 methylmutase